MELIKLLKKYWLGILLSIVALLIFNSIFGSVCYSTILFGVPCPGCGITRALKLLLSGNVKKSFEMHPLLILVLIGPVLYLFIKNRLINYRLIIKSYVIICIIIFVVFYIYRMNLYYPNKIPMVYWEDNVLHRIVILFKMWKKQ